MEMARCACVLKLFSDLSCGTHNTTEDCCIIIYDVSVFGKIRVFALHVKAINLYSHHFEERFLEAPFFTHQISVFDRFSVNGWQKRNCNDHFQTILHEYREGISQPLIVLPVGTMP